MNERIKRWLDYGAEFSLAGVGVVLIVSSIGYLYIGRPLEGVENILWGAVAMMLAHMTRRNRVLRRETNKLRDDWNRLHDDWHRIQESMTSASVQTELAAHGHCPKCHGQLAALVALRCMSCSSAYRVVATPIGPFLVEDEAASAERATKH